MARPQMLYVGNQGAVVYPGAGNFAIGSGTKGTLALWYHPSATDIRSHLVNMRVDEDNFLCLRRYAQKYIWEAESDGTPVRLEHISDPLVWRHIVATWDFTGGAGSGVLRLYMEGQEVSGSPVTTATAPIGPPEELRVGPGEDNTWVTSVAVYDQLAVWDEVMSAEQAAALYDSGRRHVPEQSDGSGTLLLRASWDGQYDADIAEGGATATLEGQADEYCRLDLGGRRRGQRFSYRLGTPAHDGSDHDRVPLFAVLPRGLYGTVTADNTDKWAVLNVDASNNGHAVGGCLAPWLAATTEPITLRCALHVVSDGAPMNLPIGVGALDYYHGDGKRLQCDTGCTASTLKSNDLSGADDYWADAEVSVITGPAANQKLRVLSYSSATKTLTLHGQLSDAPEQGNIAVVEFPRRVEPFQSGGAYCRLECDLSQSHDSIERVSVVECAVGANYGFFCVDRGRVQYYPSTVASGSVFFGKRTDQVFDPWVCSIIIERIELEGPGLRSSSESPDDTFMVKDPDADHSTKVWRADSVSRVVQQPVQYSNPALVQEEFTEAGTWRHSLWGFPTWMEYDPANDRLVAAVIGIDEGGTARAGYIWGTWNESTGRVEWTDDPDPRNPLLEIEALEQVLGAEGNLYQQFCALGGVFHTVEGTWAMTFVTILGNPDSSVHCALTGAPDKYSFDPAKHFRPEDNPITPFYGARDKLVPEGGGIGFIPTRDLDHRFVENRYTDDPSRRFWGYARAKTVLNYSTYYQEQMSRPLACVVTGDFKNVRNLPWRNTPLVPRAGWFHYPHPEWYSASTLGLIVDDGGVNQSNVTLYAADDGVHLLNPLGMPLIPKNSPPFNVSYLSPVSVPVRLGERRLYWYREGKSGMNFNMATIRLDGEVLYRLDAGKTLGELETCELRKPAAGWSELRLNVDTGQGQVRVALVDTNTEEPIAGYGHSDCDAIGEGVSVRVTWNDAGLSELTADGVRLRFELTRSGAGDQSPELYSWAALPPQPYDWPWCQEPKVEGNTNPTSVANPHPEFSWAYADPQNRPQSAFHLLVASSQELLDQNVGDLWDSDVVFSGIQTAKYQGTELGGETTYFWKVRVRNSEGVWSEEW